MLEPLHRFCNTSPNDFLKLLNNLTSTRRTRSKRPLPSQRCCSVEHCCALNLASGYPGSTQSHCSGWCRICRQKNQNNRHSLTILGVQSCNLHGKSMLKLPPPFRNCRYEGCRLGPTIS